MADSLEKIYKQIWDEYSKTVRTFCHARLQGRYHDAEALYMAAFEILWDVMLRKGVPPNPKAWLLRTAQNLVFTQYRNNTKDSEKLDRSMYVTLRLYCCDDMAEDFENEEYYQALFDELEETLNEEEKTLIYYNSILKLRQSQTAQKMGISEDAVKQRWLRLRRKMDKIKQQKRKEFGFC
ncbi:MAG: sigma-70 family RNA polymerase sigma factor [Clostridia bacterium]|nr:sigma-70 family RNA polymerase sigma factor [Clostridia bacterium]